MGKAAAGVPDRDVTAALKNYEKTILPLFPRQARRVAAGYAVMYAAQVANRYYKIVAYY